MSRIVSSPSPQSSTLQKVPPDKIAQRAYEKWVKRGMQHGSDVQDWLEAEAELRAEMARGQTAPPQPHPGQPGETAGEEEDEQDEERPQHEQGLGQGYAQHVGKAAHGARVGPVGEAEVEEGVERPAQDGPPEGARAADHDHEQEGEREGRRRHLRRRPADEKCVDNASSRGQKGGEHEHEQLVAERLQAQHLHAPFVLANRLPDTAGRGIDRPVDERRHHGQIAEGEPVEVLGVEHADEGVGQLLVVDGNALLAAGPVARVLVDQDRARLGEGERDHGEGDAAHPEADRPQDERADDADGGRERQRLPQRPVPLRGRHRGQVDAEGEVEGVAEREKSGVAEEEVVAQGHPSEHEHEAEELERPRAVQVGREHAAGTDRDEGDERGQGEEPQRRPRAEGAPQCATPFPAIPLGRTSRVRARSRTTQRSPMPAEA